MLTPTFDVVVACAPVIESPRSVVVPNPSLAIWNGEIVVVAKVLGDDVAKYKVPMILRMVQWLDVSDPSDSASWGAVEDASWRVQRGEVVPMPTTGLVSVVYIPRLSVVVAHLEAACVVSASNPQEKTPVEEDLTSQFAVLSAETVRLVVEARDEVILVVEAKDAVNVVPEKVRKADEESVSAEVVKRTVLVPPKVRSPVPPWFTRSGLPKVTSPLVSIESAATVEVANVEADDVAR